MEVKHKKYIKNSNGFTLAELLIVVAIIAVLVTIAIVVFNNSHEKAKKATCMANRRSLLGHLTTAIMVAEKSDIQDLFNAEINSDNYTCPSGGTLRCNESNNGQISITCSKHGDEGTGTAFLDIGNALKSALAADKTIKIDPRIDSNSPNGTNTALVKKQLSALNIPETSTWTILKTQSNNNAHQYVWSTVDVKENSMTNKYVPVICYDAASDRYIVGTSQVVSQALTKDGKTEKYNTIANKNLTGNAYTSIPELTGLTYEQAVAEYNKLLKQQENNGYSNN